MNPNIKIVEKPDWVTWETISEVLKKAHQDNRDQGVVMRLPMLSAEEIKNKFGDHDKFFVALDGEKVVGTGAVAIKEYSLWCNGEDARYAYVCFAAVLPEYSGMGIYKALDLRREKAAREMGVTKIIGDTHERNQHRLDIMMKVGYKFVAYKYCHDHFNIVAVKWLDGCPYSPMKCKFEFQKDRIRVKLRALIYKR